MFFFALQEHTARWRVQQRLRHVPRCFNPPSTAAEQPPLPLGQRRGVVPDHGALFRRFLVEGERRRATVLRPLTIPRPFHFQLGHPHPNRSSSFPDYYSKSKSSRSPSTYSKSKSSRSPSTTRRSREAVGQEKRKKKDSLK